MLTHQEYNKNKIPSNKQLIELLTQATPHKELNNLYTLYLESNQTELSLKAEKEIWQTLIKTESAETLEKLFILHLRDYSQRKKAIRFVMDWISLQDNPINAIAIYHKIKRILVGRYRLEIFDSEFNKVTKQHILSLEINDPLKSIVNPPSEDTKQRIKTFLGVPRNSFFCCYRKTTSEKIYDKLHEAHQYASAIKDFETEQTKLFKEINLKLN